MAGAACLLLKEHNRSTHTHTHTHTCPHAHTLSTSPQALTELLPLPLVLLLHFPRDTCDHELREKLQQLGQAGVQPLHLTNAASVGNAHGGFQRLSPTAHATTPAHTSTHQHTPALRSYQVVAAGSGQSVVEVEHGFGKGFQARQDLLEVSCWGLRCWTSQVACR